MSLLDPERSLRVHSKQYKQNYHSGVMEDSHQFKVLNDVEYINKTLNNKFFSHDEFLGQIDKEKFNICFDLGSGTGWVSNYLSKYFEKVIAIEPSKHANSIAKNLYKNKNIAFVENRIDKYFSGNIVFNDCFLYSNVVFTHLPDWKVKKCFKKIRNSIKGEVKGILLETWGEKDEYEPMYRSRSQTKWKKILQDFEITFIDYKLNHYLRRGIIVHGWKAD